MWAAAVYRRDGKRLGSDHNIMGTALDPLYQTQLRGVESYRFDVPDGNYRLTLLFAELDRASQADRSFDIVVNGGRWPRMSIWPRATESTGPCRSVTTYARKKGRASVSIFLSAGARPFSTESC